MNTSKRGVTLDLAAPEGRDLFERLAATADLVIETFPPGHLDDLGLGYRALAAANPALVLTSITGFGADGPVPGFQVARISSPAPWAARCTSPARRRTRR